MSLVDLQKQEEAEAASYLSYEEVEEETEEVELDLSEFDGMELPEMDDEFDVNPTEHQMGQYGVVITKDRPLRKQSFNSKGKEVEFREHSIPETVEYVSIPIRPQTLAMCEENAKKSKKVEDAQSAADLHAEVKRMREEVKENKRVNELKLMAEQGRKQAAESRRKMNARRLGIIQ
jgi:hypothetical protein